MTLHDETGLDPRHDIDATAERPAVRFDVPFEDHLGGPSGAHRDESAPGETLLVPVLDHPHASDEHDQHDAHDVYDGEASAESAAGSEAESGADRPMRGPSWWHRSHPVFTPLTGFFTGLLVVIVVPGGYGAFITRTLGDDKVKGLLPYAALVLLIPLGLLAPRATRRFGRYMLFGMLSVAVVVLGAAALTLWYLYTHDG